MVNLKEEISREQRDKCRWRMIFEGVGHDAWDYAYNSLHDTLWERVRYGILFNVVDSISPGDWRHFNL